MEKRYYLIQLEENELLTGNTNVCVIPVDPESIQLTRTKHCFDMVEGSFKLYNCDSIALHGNRIKGTM